MFSSLVVFRSAQSALAGAVLVTTSLSVAIPARSQPAADVRAVLVAAAREMVRDTSVISLEVADSAYARAVASFIHAQRLVARRPFVPSTVTLRRWQIFADSAHVDVDQQVASRGPHASFAEHRLTLQRRAGHWVPARWDLLGVP
jgi:hypothetical protein